MFKNKYTRFLYFDSPTPPETASESVESYKAKLERVRSFLQKVHALDEKNKDNKLLVVDTSENTLSENPYGSYLSNFVEQLSGDDINEVDSLLTKGQGVVTIKFKTRGPIDIQGKVYNALVWPSIQPKLNEIFDGKKVTPELLKLAAESDKANLDTLVYKLSVHGEAKPALVAEVLTGLDVLRPQLNPEGFRERTEVRGEAERGKLKKDVAEITVNQALGFKAQEPRLAEWSANIKRKPAGVNPERWAPETRSGLIKMREEWRFVFGDEVGSYEKGLNGNPFYEEAFNQLAKSSDKAFLSKIKNEDLKQAYMNPSLHLDVLREADPNFYRAWNYVDSVKSVVSSLALETRGTVTKRAALDKEPISNTIQKGLSDNWNKFTHSIQDGDWATAAMYVAGVWALYEVYDRNKDLLGKDHKWLIYGVGGYMGYIFAKNAGFDVAKKLGIKSVDYDVKGTEMAPLYHLQIPETKSLDSLVALRAGSIPMTELYKKYQDTFTQADKKEIGFINPALFPSQFPEFAGRHTSEVTTDKMYEKTGHQLYLLMDVLIKAYNKTLKEDKGLPQFYGKSFDEILKDPILGQSNIEDFVATLKSYTGDVKSSVFEPGALSEAKERLHRELKDKGISGYFDSLEIDKEKHAFTGRINGLPVVVVPDNAGGKNIYRVFSRKEYDQKKGQIHNTSQLGKIPFEGDITNEAKDLDSAVKAKVKALVKPVVSNAGYTLGQEPKFDGQNWSFDMKVPAAAAFNIPERQAKAVITITDEEMISIDMDGAAVAVNIDYFMDKTYPYAGVLLSMMVADEDLALFKYFLPGHKIDFASADPENGKFKIKVAGETVEIKFDKAKNDFSMEDAEQKKLLKSEEFKKIFAESMLQEPELKKTLESIAALLDNTPSEYFINVFKNLPGWVTNATWDSLFRGVKLSTFTGSVPKNYTRALLDIHTDLLVTKLTYSLNSANSLKDVSDAVGNVFTPGVNKLKHLEAELSSLNTKNYKEGDKFSTADFMDKVLVPLDEVGVRSKDFKFWKTKFTNEIFERFGMDNWRDENAKKARDVVKVFAYYTAKVDDPSIDGANLAMRITPEMKEAINKVNPFIENYKRTNNGSEPTEAQIAAGLSISAADANKFVEWTNEFNKTEKYKLHRDYTNFVAGQIYLKFNQGALDSGLIPGPSSFWEIPDFDAWKVNRPIPMATETLVDANNTLKPYSSYTTFDEYLGYTPAERAAKGIKEENIILPRKTVDLRFNPATKEADKDLFWRLLKLEDSQGLEDWNEKTIEKENQDLNNRGFTDIEKNFRDTMMEALHKLETKYNVNPQAFGDLKKDYSLDFKIGNLVNGEYDPAAVNENGVPVIRWTAFANSLTVEAKGLEEEFASFSRTLTKDEQELMIKKRVTELIKNTVVNSPNFNTYFNEPSIKAKITGSLQDFWAWLWG